MSDSVHYLTYEDTGTPANSSGCNGFPVPFNAGGVANVYDTQVTLKDCVKWQFRVKEWELVTDFSVTGPAGNAFIVSPQTTTSPIGPFTELDMFQLGSRKVHDALANGGTNVASGTNAAIFLFGEMATTVPMPAIKFSSPNYFPWIRLVADVATVANGDVQFDSVQSVVSPPDGSITATIDGYNVTLYYKSSLAPGYTFTATQLNFTPKTYWPYKGANGNPIYNTSTGAQLQNPRN